MKISQENLTQLKSKEYKKYNSLRKKSFDGEGIGCLAYVLLHLLIATLFAGVCKRFGGEWTAMFLLYVFCIPYSIIPTGLIGEGLNRLFGLEDLFKRISHRSLRYQKLKQLENYFLEVENQLKDQIQNYIDFELDGLIAEMQLNQENRNLYPKLLKTFTFNHQFVEESANILKLRGLFSNYKSKLKRKNIWFEEDLRKAEQIRDRQKLSDQINTKSTKDKFSDSMSILGIASEYHTNRANDKPLPPKSLLLLNNDLVSLPDKLKNKTSEPKAPLQELNKPATEFNKKETNETNLPVTLREKILTNQIRERTNPAGGLEETKVIPTKLKRKGLSKPRIIKVSPQFWENLGKKRMETGKRGELLVLEYERERIIREEGESNLDKLEHSSIVRGDGLGCDISSYNKDEIYIEVKTTTGDFWSNIIFSQNEVSAMNELGNQYFLYRVYEFDKSTNIGKLRIFKGKEEINSTFDFTPNTYTLKPKGH